MRRVKSLIQGITGKQGTFHGTRMVRYNTNVVGGVTPGKGGQEVDLDGRRVPVYNNMREAVSDTGADVSAIYVPARFGYARFMRPQRHSMRMVAD